MGATPKPAKRTKRMHVRITEAEYKQLLEDIKGTGHNTLADYLRELIFTRRHIVTVNRSGLMELLYAFRSELKKQGVNINQIAAGINRAWLADRSFPDNTVTELNKTMKVKVELLGQLRGLVDRAFVKFRD